MTNAEPILCRLCRLEKPLVESHFFPKLAYRAVKDSEDSDPIIVSQATTMVHMFQVKDYLLCTDCEGRFRDLETYIASLIRRPEKNAFPLMDFARQGVLAAKIEDREVRCTSELTGLDHEKIAAFALSIVWRGSVHAWSDLKGRKFTPSPLGSLEPKIREYLLGHSPFPHEAAVWVNVLDNEPGISIIFPVKRDFDETTGHDFEMCGIQFIVVVGNDIPSAQRTFCILNGDRHPIGIVDGNKAPPKKGLLKMIDESRKTEQFKRRFNAKGKM